MSIAHEDETKEWPWVYATATPFGNVAFQVPEGTMIEESRDLSVVRLTQLIETVERGPNNQANITVNPKWWTPYMTGSVDHDQLVHIPAHHIHAKAWANTKAEREMKTVWGLSKIVLPDEDGKVLRAAQNPRGVK